MYRSLLPSSVDLFAQFDRLQQEMGQAFGEFGFPSSIRAVASGSFPPVNIGTTPNSVEIYAFAPGVDPAKLDITLDRGVLTLAGERQTALPGEEQKASVYAAERFTGNFKRAISLPEDVNPDSTAASYNDGVLKITLQRAQAPQAKRIEIR